MNPNTTNTNRTNKMKTSALLLGLLSVGCGPTFDPASLIETTRVLGARVEVEGAPDRATPRPGETANVTWLVSSPEATPPLGWAFALCTPGTVGGKASLGCASTPLALFQGTASPPRITMTVPPADVLGTGTRVILYGEICSGLDSVPTFDPQGGLPSCTNGGGNGNGTTASVSIPLQLGDEANHHPVADRAFTFDGQPWAPPAAGDDPCVAGPRVLAGSEDHVIGNTIAAADRESYSVVPGVPAAAPPVRETLQISQFTTAGKLRNQFSFVDAPDANADTTVDVKWNAPTTAVVPAAGLPVTFTFVVRDNRGGIDWTTRAACVDP